MKEFTSTIKIEFSFNNLEAENKEKLWLVVTNSKFKRAV